jgi:hypothetical protein
MTDFFGLRFVYGLFALLALLNIPFIANRPQSIKNICKTD